MRSRPLCDSQRTTTHPHPGFAGSPAHRDPGVPGGRAGRCYGGHSGGETPGLIPNPEAKPSSADGTAPGRVWESRTPPDIFRIEGRPPDFRRATLDPFVPSPPYRVRMYL